MIGFTTMTRAGVVVAMVVGLSACSANPSGPIAGASTTSAPTIQPSPRVPYYRVTVASAAISSTRPDGSPWHSKPPGHTGKVIGAVTGFIVGQPELGTAAGSLFDKPGTTFGPAPFVTLSLNGKTYDTAALEPGLNPRWNEDVVIDVSGAEMSDPVLIMLRDAIDGGVISQRTLTLRELVSREGHTLPMDNGIISVELMVRAANPQSHDEIVAVESGRPIRIAFEGGDLVQFVASGEVCVRSDRCVGPDGDPEDEPTMSFDDIAHPRPRGQRFNYAEFIWARHGSLVALFDGRPISVGSSTTVRIPRSGEVIMLVNDSDFANNSGSFSVTIRVNPTLAVHR